MRQGVTRVGISASLLALLAACTTLPPPERADAHRPAAKLPARPEPPGLAPEAAPLPGAAEDGSDLLGGEVPRELQRGQASWYGPGFQGRRTASGERYDMHALTAAHRTLPFGTLVRVRSLVNGREVDVRINDRGPFSRGRVIDLSRAAAETLDMLGFGVKDVLLLVPESTLPVAEPPPPAKKSPQALRRAAGPRAR